MQTLHLHYRPAVLPRSSPARGPFPPIRRLVQQPSQLILAQSRAAVTRFIAVAKIVSLPASRSGGGAHLPQPRIDVEGQIASIYAANGPHRAPAHNSRLRPSVSNRDALSHPWGHARRSSSIVPRHTLRAGNSVGLGPRWIGLDRAIDVRWTDAGPFDRLQSGVEVSSPTFGLIIPQWPGTSREGLLSFQAQTPIFQFLLVLLKNLKLKHN